MQGKDDPASMGETAMLQAEKLRKAIYEITSNPYMSWDDLNIVGTCLIVDEKDLVALHEIVQRWYIEKGLMPWEREGAKIEIGKFIDRLWFKWKQARQDLTTIGASMPPTKKSRMSFFHVEKKLFAQYTIPGRTTVVTGDMGTGKTNTAVNDIGAESLDMGHYVCSNVPYIEIGGLQDIGNEENYLFTTKFSKLLLFACENCIRGIEDTGRPYKTIHINDETILSRSKMRQSSIPYQAQKVFTQMSRHFKVHGVSIEQMLGDTPPEVIQFQSQIIVKESLSNQGLGDWRSKDWKLHYSLSHMFDWKQRRDMNTMKKKMPYIEYDTYGITSFDVDIDIFALFNYVMTATEDGNLETTEQFELMIKFIKQHTGDYEMTKDFLENYVWYTYLNSLKIQDAVESNPKLKKKYAWMLPMNASRISEMLGWHLDVGYDTARRRVERIIDKRMKMEDEKANLFGTAGMVGK